MFTLLTPICDLKSCLIRICILTILVSVCIAFLLFCCFFSLLSFLGFHLFFYVFCSKCVSECHLAWAIKTQIILPQINSLTVSLLLLLLFLSIFMKIAFRLNMKCFFEEWILMCWQLLWNNIKSLKLHEDERGKEEKRKKKQHKLAIRLDLKNNVITYIGLNTEICVFRMQTDSF